MSIGTGIGAGLATALIATAALVGLNDHVTPESGRVTATQAEITSSELRWPPFPKSRFWSRPIERGAPTDPASSLFTAYLNEQLQKSNGQGPFLAVRSYGVPIWAGRRGDPVVTLGPCYRYRCPGLGGARVRLPRGARPDPGSDGHMVIVDSRRRVAYDLFRARESGGKWAGAGGARVDLQDGDGSTGRLTGATASHSALLAGLIRPVEIRRGRIDHALAINVPGIGRGAPRCPADSNVPTSDRRAAPPEGMRFQLDPALNLDMLNLSRLERVIARALQRYGMIVTDNSGQVAFRGENYVGKPVDGWSRLGYPHGDSLSLRQIPFDRMRAIAGSHC